MKLIDADRLIEWFTPYLHAGEPIPADVVIEDIKAAPTLTQPGGWISVEDGTPEAEKEVRMCCVTSTGYRYQCQGFYIPPGTHLEDSRYTWDRELCKEYDDEQGDYLVRPGFYETVHNRDEYCGIWIRGKATHWAPLPEPPKEGSNGN